MFDLSLAELLGAAAFVLHLLAYVWYANGIFHERIRPNAAAWFMWLVGNIVEFLTYDSLAGSHWSTSALPFACVLGVTLILIATAYAQLRERGRRTGHAVYHSPEQSDYLLISFDLGAAALWLTKGWAGVANVLAVSTSITSFLPIWRTTYFHHDKEHLWPWVIWSIAYFFMFVAVLLETEEGLIWRSFYPLYYLSLHLVVVGMFFPRFRQSVSPLIGRSRQN